MMHYIKTVVQRIEHICPEQAPIVAVAADGSCYPVVDRQTDIDLARSAGLVGP